MRKFEYDYLDTDISNQYSGVEFEVGKAVDAVYVKSPCEFDNGNPFIEALPRPRLDDEVTRDYEVAIKNFKPGMKTEYQALIEISSLRELRFKLPFHKGLEIEHYTCLINSYRDREFLIGNDSCRVIGSTFGGASIGYNLLGSSGSGKTSAVKILLIRYPQLINHDFKELGHFKQITYIMVSTTANDNFSALYDSMARAIDQALGFSEPVYEQIMNKKRGLGQKTAYIESLVETFSIGMILIDEIQLMSFSFSKENSFTTLAKIANDTKACISVIGLPQAIQKMFDKEWTARRVGATIDSNVYCDNYKYFSVILNKLLQYNWLKHPVILTEEGVAALFKYTNGAIAHLISFYMRFQLDNLNSDEQVTITGKCVEKLMNKYFNGLITIISKDNKRRKKDIALAELQRQEMIEASNKKLDDDIQAKLQEAEMEIQIIGKDEYEKTVILQELESYVVDTILIFEPNKNIETIKTCFKRVMNKNKTNIENSKKEVLQMVLKELKKKRTIKQELIPKQVPRMI